MTKKIQILLAMLLITIITGFVFYSKFFKNDERFSVDKRYSSSVGSELLYPSEIPSHPRLFFHGSGEKLDYLEPKSISTRNDNEGDVVFATSYLSYAVLFTLALPREGSVLSIRLRSFDHGPHIVLCNNKEAWLKYDTGGYVHVVSSDSFYVDLGFLGTTRGEWMSQSYNPEWGSLAEWVSKEKVPVLHDFKIDNTLEALLSLGVQLFFVDEDTFKSYQQIKDDSSLRKFMKGLTSENEIRGIGHKSLY